MLVREPNFFLSSPLHWYFLGYKLIIALLYWSIAYASIDASTSHAISKREDRGGGGGGGRGRPVGDS